MNTELEQRLAAIWRDELNVADVGLDDNFFDRGGRSVLLVRVHHRLVRELHREVPIVTLFRYPTIRTLARHLSGDSEHEGRGEALAERRRARRGQLNARRPLRRPTEGPNS